MLLTKDGLQNLQQEYQQLLNERPAAVLDLKKAREMGDLSENGYYKAARSKLSSIDHRLRRLKRTIQSARIISTVISDHVQIGNTVTLQNEEREHKFQIVGSLEADPKERKISNISPIGNQLLGKKIGDKIEIQDKTFVITSIS